MKRYLKITLGAITTILCIYSLFNNNIPIKYLLILLAILSLINGIEGFKKKDKTTAYLSTAASVLLFVDVISKLFR